jgi:Raf kinase inhibitor-like YbhB/YbcL family protein
MAFTLTSTAFADGADIPIRYTCEGENRSPHLTWSGTPDGTRSLALIVDDPDAPGGVFVHWVLCDIPPDVHELTEHVAGATVGMSGRNSFGKVGYGGPCPPPGDPPHRYRFTLFALDVPSLGLSGIPSREDVDAAMETHIIGTAHLTGRYQRQRAARGR